MMTMNTAMETQDDFQVRPFRNYSVNLGIPFGKKVFLKASWDSKSRGCHESLPDSMVLPRSATLRSFGPNITSQTKKPQRTTNISY